jgi:hypothetical protein
VSQDEERCVPDVEALARSMLLVHGAHDDNHEQDDDHEQDNNHEKDEDEHVARGANGAWRTKAVGSDPRRAAELRAATARDRERYLNSGLQPVDCRFCHVSVLVKKLGPEHTSVQWNSGAAQRCAYFAEVRESGGVTARSRSCPKLADSIDHAIAEGILESVSTAPSPGDG